MASPLPARRVLDEPAPAEALGRGRGEILPEHILLAILQARETAGVVLLRGLLVDLRRFTRRLEQLALSPGPSAGKGKVDTRDAILLTAWQIAREAADGHIGTEHILLALLFECETSKSRSEDEGANLPFEALKALFAEFALDFHTVQQLHAELFSPPPERAAFVEPSNFAEDWTRPELEMAPLPIRGRESEVDRILIALGRRKHGLVALMGNSGTGKTAVMRELARRLGAGTVPARFRNQHLVAVNCATMADDFDLVRRLDRILRGLRGAPNVIIFLDQAHDLPPMHGAALAFYLGARELSCVAASSREVEHWSSGKALMGGVSEFRIEALDDVTTSEVLRDVRPELEHRFDLSLSDDILEKVLRAAGERRCTNFPGAAVELLEAAGAWMHAHRHGKARRGLTVRRIREIARRVFL